MIKLSIGVLLLVALTTGQGRAFGAEAYFFNGAQTSWLSLSSKTPIKVLIKDDVNGGCWTNTRAVKTGIELELTRSGYVITDSDKDADYYIEFSGLGGNFGEADSCVISWHFEIQKYVINRHSSDDHVLNEGMWVTVWRRYQLFSNDKADTNNIMKQRAVEKAQEFLVEIPKAQRNAIEKILESEHASSSAKNYWSKFKPK